MLKKIKFLNLVLAAFLVFTFVAPTQAAIQCLNFKQQPVDWWVIFKLPTNTDPETNGVSYFYFDQTGAQYFSDANHAITRSDHPLAYTLNQIYNDSTNTATSWVMYNDEPASNTAANSNYYDFAHGHTKGVLAFDDASGFWLMQSVPGFPPAQKDGYSYPDSGRLNGQSMLCVSLPTSSFENIGKQFRYTNPNVYDAHFDDESLAPSLVGFVKQEDKRYQPITAAAFNQQNYTSINKTTEFRSYVQTNTNTGTTNDDPENPDFYACIANNDKSTCNGGFTEPLQHSLFTQTWLNSNTPEEQTCKFPYHVNDADTFSLTTDNTTFTWATKNDHSKWAVATDNNATTVCFSDLNRTEQQKLRGGGALCFENATLHKLMRKMVATTETCK